MSKHSIDSSGEVFALPHIGQRIGKTTVANIIAAKTNRVLHKLNATMASSTDIKQMVAQREQERNAYLQAQGENGDGNPEGSEDASQANADDSADL